LEGFVLDSKLIHPPSQTPTKNAHLINLPNLFLCCPESIVFVHASMLVVVDV